jgi:DNA mismatch repair ATPase MutS
MRANDSLDENASYFYAELKRLRFIVEALANGKPMLVLLDEILRGTNSLDKQKGSLAFVRKLVSLGATGMMATHDLELGVLAEEYPGKVLNRCFEVETHAEGLYFDYKLYEGVCKNLNAVYLMKSMGIM